MARDVYLASLRRKLGDLEYQMARCRNMLAAGDLSDRERIDLAATVAQMQLRHDELQDKLGGLEHEPDGTWARLRAEWELEWDTLVQDFEERIGRLS